MRRVCPETTLHGQREVGWWAELAWRGRDAGSPGGRGSVRLAAEEDGNGPDGSVLLDLVHGLLEQGGRLMRRVDRPCPERLDESDCAASKVGGQEGADPTTPFADWQSDLSPCHRLQADIL